MGASGGRHHCLNTKRPLLTTRNERMAAAAPANGQETRWPRINREWDPQGRHERLYAVATLVRHVQRALEGITAAAKWRAIAAVMTSIKSKERSDKRLAQARQCRSGQVRGKMRPCAHCQHATVIESSPLAAQAVQRIRDWSSEANHRSHWGVRLEISQRPTERYKASKVSRFECQPHTPRLSLNDDLPAFQRIS